MASERAPDKSAPFQKSQPLTITLTPCLRSGNICFRPFLSLCAAASSAGPANSAPPLPPCNRPWVCVFWHHPTHPPISLHSSVLSPSCSWTPEPASQSLTPMASRPPPPQKQPRKTQHILRGSSVNHSGCLQTTSNQDGKRRYKKQPSTQPSGLPTTCRTHMLILPFTPTLRKVLREEGLPLCLDF